MAAKLLNLVALSSLAILACSFGSTPVNALSIDTSPNHARSLGGHHNLVAKKKRQQTRRCKPRPSTSSSQVPVGSPTPAPTPAPTPDPPKTDPTPPPAPPPSNPPPSTGGGGGGKVGLAWPIGDNPALKNFKTDKVTSILSWSPWKPAGSDALGLEFAPMLWGAKQLDDFTRLVKPGYAKVALGFNEPDHGSQANLSPGAAVDLWWRAMEPLSNQGYRLISPAVTSAPAGKTWLSNFINGCQGCHIDAIALHWYGTNAQDFINYITDFHTTFGKNIWVTEYACQSFTNAPQCNAGQITNFMNTVTAFMDSTPWVEKYFAYAVMPNMGDVNPLNALMGSNGQPTPLGWDYLT